MKLKYMKRKNMNKKEKIFAFWSKKNANFLCYRNQQSHPKPAFIA